MRYILYFILVFLTTYTDTPLQKYFGAFGFSSLPILSYVIYAIFIVTKRKIPNNKFAKDFFKLINYAFILSFIAILIVAIEGLSLDVKGTSILIKTFNLYATFIGYVLFVLIISSITQKLTINQIYSPFFYTFIILSVYGYFEYQMIPNSFLSLHGTNQIYWRIRLLTAESSWTAPILEIFFLMSFYFTYYIKKSKLLTFIVVACLFYQISISSSKSFMIIILLSVMYGGWNYILKVNRKYKFITLLLSVFIALLSIMVILPRLQEDMTYDIEESTSFATRFITILAGLCVGTFFPFGSGFGSYLYLLPRSLNYIFSFFSNYGLNIDEIKTIYFMSDSNAGMTAKSFFGQSSMYWGILGSIYFFRKFFAFFKISMQRINPNEQLIYKMLLFIITINLFLMSDMEYLYLLVISLLYRVSKNNE